MLTEKLARECGWKNYGEHYDLAVIGAGPAGLGAAIRAGRLGLKVILVESTGIPGGTGAHALVGNFFAGSPIKGIAEEMVRRLGKKNKAFEYYDGQALDYRPIGDQPLIKRTAMEVSAMKREYNTLLKEAGVDCLYYTKLVEAVRDENGNVKAAVISCVEGMYLLEADYFVDASGDAHLMASAGATMKKFALDRMMHTSLTTLIGGISVFHNDCAQQRYRELYDAKKFKGKVWNWFGYSWTMTPGEINTIYDFNAGDTVNSKELTRMGIELLDEIHENFEVLKEEMPAFENAYINRTADRVGIRSGWSFEGMATIDRDYINSGVLTDEPVALIRRSFGSHSSSAEKTFNAEWLTINSGYTSVPMKAMLSAEVPNVAVAGRCISSDGYTIDTFRMIEQCMSMGEAAAVMTLVAKRNNVPLNAVEYKQVREELDKLDLYIIPEQADKMLDDYLGPNRPR